MDNNPSHIDPKEIQKYLNNQLSQAERHDLEKKALDDPFANEAWEGFDQFEDPEIASDLAELQSRLEKRLITPTYNFNLRIAAAVVLLIGFGFILYYYVPNSTQTTNRELALNDDKSVNEDKLEQSPNFEKDTEASPSENSPTEKSKAVTVDEIQTPQQLSEEETQKELSILNEQKESNTLAETNALALTDKKLKDSEPPASAEVTEALQGRVAGVEISRLNRSESISLAEEKALQKSAKKASPAPTAPQASSSSAMRTISGRVISGSDNTGLPGVSIIIPQSTTGTVTDVNGNFKLNIDQNTEIILASFIGFETSEIEISSNNEVEVVMNEDVSQLSEVVITGYSSNQDDPTSIEYERALPEIGSWQLNRYIKEQLIYPKLADSLQIEGRVVLQFIVTSEGKLIDFKVLKSLGYGCDEEAIRLIKNGPAWIPAKENDIPIDREVRMTIRFKKK